MPSFVFLTSLVLVPWRLVFGSHGICLPFSSMRGMFGCGFGSTLSGVGPGSIGPVTVPLQQSPEEITTGCGLVAMRKRVRSPGRSLVLQVLQLRHMLQPATAKIEAAIAIGARYLRSMGIIRVSCVEVVGSSGWLRHLDCAR